MGWPYACAGHLLGDYVRWLKRFQGTLTDGRSCLIGQIPAKRCLPQVSLRNIVAGLFSNNKLIAITKVKILLLLLLYKACKCDSSIAVGVCRVAISQEVVTLARI